jgi:hypothetical protein
MPGLSWIVRPMPDATVRYRLVTCGRMAVARREGGGKIHVHLELEVGMSAPDSATSTDANPPKKHADDDICINCGTTRPMHLPDPAARYVHCRDFEPMPRA